MAADAYRAPMRSRRDDVDPALAVRRALDLGVCGIGTPMTERDRERLDRFCAVPDGSFVWTRVDECFHLGRIAGPCRTDSTEAARLADLTQVRECEWLTSPVDPTLVPEQVRYAFSRGGRNFQGIRSAGAGEATARAWELSS